MTPEQWFELFKEETKALVNQKILNSNDASAIASAFARIAASATPPEEREHWFWCSLHSKAHRQGDDRRECLLTGPYSSKEQADEFGGVPTFAARCRPAVKAYLTKAEQAVLKVGGIYPEHYRALLEKDANDTRALLDEIDALTAPPSPPRRDSMAESIAKQIEDGAPGDSQANR